MTTTTVLDRLNDYSGNNIWEDVIYHLGYDEAATDRECKEFDRNPAYSDLVVIDGVTYVYDYPHGEWATA